MIVKTNEAHSDKPQRTRKAHNKVRTGCLTCKIRRKKCDETKPACLRCTSTGRKCDGYAAAPPPLIQSSWSPNTGCTTPSAPGLAQVVATSQLPAPKLLEIDLNSGYGTSELGDMNDTETPEEEELNEFILSYDSDKTSQAGNPAVNCMITNNKRRRRGHMTNAAAPFFPRPPNFFAPGNEISDLESHCFSHFRHRTGPQFMGYFDSTIWRTYSINGALAHPVLFSVATALGAVHRRFSYGISPAAFEYCGHAARLHAKATRQLNELKSQHVNSNLIGTANPGGGGAMGLYDRDVIMVAELLLGLFEAFQGEYEQSVRHTNNGMKYLLNRPMTLCYSETKHLSVGKQPDMLYEMFYQMNTRAQALFGSPTRILVEYGDGPLPPIPSVFNDIEQARDYTFTEINWIMHVPHNVWQDSVQRSEAQNLHVSRLLQWGVAYAEMVRKNDRTPRQKRQCQLIRACRGSTYLLLYLTLYLPNESESPDEPDNTEKFDNDKDTSETQVTSATDVASVEVLSNRNLADKIISDGVMWGGVIWKGDTWNNDKQCVNVTTSTSPPATCSLWNIVEKREELKINLARIKILTDALLEENGIWSYDEHSVEWDTSIGPPRAPDKTPESSNKTRHLVKWLRTNRQNDTAMWEMLGVYGVMERLSAVEEHAVIEAIRGIIPEHIDPRWVDITCLMESRRILLRYCAPDEWGAGMVWTQQWWAF